MRPTFRLLAYLAANEERNTWVLDGVDRFSKLKGKVENILKIRLTNAMKLLSIQKIAFCASSAVLASSAFADIDHLDIPTTYDNIGGSIFYGQTFVANEDFISGVRVYVGDPTRPNDLSVNELTGPANLFLYEATSLSSPTRIASNSILSSAETANGLFTFNFDRAISTTPGTRYFFGFDTVDTFGIGLRDSLSSTYLDGAEGFLDSATGQLTLHPTGRDLSFSVLGSPIAAQKVYLAWGAVVPARISAKVSPFIGEPYATDLGGTMAAVLPDPTFQGQLQQAVQGIFDRSGIHNITFVSTPSPDATSVYFTDPIDNSLVGKAYTGVNRFNSRRDDKVAIFLRADVESPFGFNLEFTAETVAHELGHSFGLSHINPGTAEIMDYTPAPGIDDAFTNVVTTRVRYDAGNNPISINGSTHNPQYHLGRYVDGRSNASLIQEGIDHGNYDITFLDSILFTLDFGDADLTLFDVFLLAGDGSADSSVTLAHFEATTLSALEALEFVLDSESRFSLVASSLPGNDFDVILSLGNPFETNNTVISPIAGELAAFIQQQSVASQGYTTIATATISATVVPEPSSAFLVLVGASFCLRQVSLRRQPTGSRA